MNAVTREQALDQAQALYPNATSLVADIDTLPFVPGVYEAKYVVNVRVYLGFDSEDCITLQSDWDYTEVDGDCLERLFDLSVNRDRAEVAA